LAVSAEQNDLAVRGIESHGVHSSPGWAVLRELLGPVGRGLRYSVRYGKQEQ